MWEGRVNRRNSPALCGALSQTAAVTLSKRDPSSWLPHAAHLDGDWRTNTSYP